MCKTNFFSKNPNSDSISLKVTNTISKAVATDIKIDMNIKYLDINNQISIGTLHFADLYTMFASKLYIAATPKIYRRIKDLYDIYSITEFNKKINTIDYTKLYERFSKLYLPQIANICPLECFSEHYREQLQHAYERNDLFVKLKPFDTIFDIAIYTIHEFYLNSEWGV